MTDRQPTRERILAAALELIGRHGVGGLTNRAIAARAGVSLGSVTYHFASQRELLGEAVTHFVRAESARLAGAARHWEGRVTTVEQAAHIVAAVADEITAGGVAHAELAPLELYVHAGREPALRSAATDSFAAYDALATTVLAALDVTDAERLAPAVVSLVLGLQLRRVATGKPGTDVAAAVTALVRGTEPAP